MQFASRLFSLSFPDCKLSSLLYHTFFSLFSHYMSGQCLCVCVCVYVCVCVCVCVQLAGPEHHEDAALHLFAFRRSQGTGPKDARRPQPGPKPCVTKPTSPSLQPKTRHHKGFSVLPMRSSCLMAGMGMDLGGVRLDSQIKLFCMTTFRVWSQHCEWRPGPPVAPPSRTQGKAREWFLLHPALIRWKRLSFRLRSPTYLTCRHTNTALTHGTPTSALRSFRAPGWWRTCAWRDCPRVRRFLRAASFVVSLGSLQLWCRREAQVS